LILAHARRCCQRGDLLGAGLIGMRGKLIQKIRQATRVVAVGDARIGCRRCPLSPGDEAADSAANN
jgi:hypothetical protein